MSITGYVMIKKKPLTSYKKKRNFTATPEPSGKTVAKKKSKDLLFVIQKHQASHLHYDFRIEVNGALKSWAVPKGPSIDPSQKRLAMPTEDHPYDYAHFEGIIPEGNYGAGTVMVWDIGTYTLIEKENPISMKEALKNGQVEIWLEGKKLHGGYTLIRIGTGTDDERWLLIKMRDEYADKKRGINERSALTNRTMNQITKEG